MLLGLSDVMVAVFVSFGLMIGTLFGFFGMGGSFLVTPALLVMGYRPSVAVGSGLAFVFGTSIIAALRHRDHGQVDYKLAGVFIVAMTAGLEIGKELILALEATGSADVLVSIAYVVLLGGVGLLVLRDARAGPSDGNGETPALAARIQQYRIPPMVSFKGGVEASLWVALALALFIGVLSGLLGVGGGFLLMPAMMYVLDVPAAIAVGTSVLQITIPGGFGAFLYAQSGAVNLPVVGLLLAGSALGARIGSATTTYVDEDDIKGYFAAMLLMGSVAVAARKVGHVMHVQALTTVSIVLIIGGALLVSGAVVYSGVAALRHPSEPSVASAD